MSEQNKILIIDDEPSLLKIMSKFLQKLGFEAETAENGRIGIEAMKKSPNSFKALFLDYNLPEMSSFEILSEIRKLNPEIKAILSTGFSVDEIRKEFTGLRIDGTLQKPFTFADFKNILSEL